LLRVDLQRPVDLDAVAVREPGIGAHPLAEDSHALRVDPRCGERVAHRGARRQLELHDLGTIGVRLD
jgi:hypothetical protein